MSESSLGIVAFGAYLPAQRLDRSSIHSTLGQGGGRGSRAVAGYDEDTTSMAVEAARAARWTETPSSASLHFATTAPAYADKTNATAIHAALELADDGIYDCSGVADGAAAALIVRSEDAEHYTDRPIYVKALALAAGPAEGPIDPGYDFTTFDEVVVSARDAYAQAGVGDPRREISLAEVHDCFTPTELVLMEDLGFSERGRGWKDVLDGLFDLDGELPVNPDGGLKSFGHPIGASGLRMLFECWLQFREEAGPRQLEDPQLGLTHNLGGQPGACVSFVSIVGREKE